MEICINILFLIFVLSIGCVSGTTSSQEVNEFVSHFSDGYTKKSGLKFKEVGLSFPQNILYGIDVGYYSCNSADIPQARKMIVELTEAFSKAYHNEASLSKFLEKSDDEKHGITVNISFPQQQDPQSICYAFYCKNKIFYFNRIEEVIGLNKLLEEPYAEAYEKVMMESHGQ